MRTSIAALVAAAVGIVLAGCAAQKVQRGTESSAALSPSPVRYRTTVTIERAMQSAVYPQKPRLVVEGCAVAHPLYRAAKTLVLGPTRGHEFEVQLKPHSPALADKATVIVMRACASSRYYIDRSPLDRNAQIVLEPGSYQILLLVLGEMVPVADVKLEPDTDYFACLGEI